jgi:hypothetical protein
LNSNNQKNFKEINKNLIKKISKENQNIKLSGATTAAPNQNTNNDKKITQKNSENIKNFKSPRNPSNQLIQIQ